MEITIKIDTDKTSATSRVWLDGIDVSAELIAVEAHADIDGSRVKLTKHSRSDTAKMPAVVREKLAEFEALLEP